MTSKTNIRPIPLLISALIVLLSLAALVIFGNKTIKGEKDTMQTYHLGRFSLAIPTEMKLKIRSSKLRYVEIRECIWPMDRSPEQARTIEWEQLISKIKKLDHPDGKDRVIISMLDLKGVGKWADGVLYYRNSFDDASATNTVLVDTGQLGVWFDGDPTHIADEDNSHRMINNIKNIANCYQSIDLKNPNTTRTDNRFYLEYGAINLPYSAQEETIARFEGHPLDLKLLVEMETDFEHNIDPMGLISMTRGMLAASLITPGGSVSKIRLRKREVAGMPGEEAVLKVREGRDTDLVFTWEYNGKDDSGEYPTTRINMESPGGSLDEKLKIWDAILDSMKPMFERKR